MHNNHNRTAFSPLSSHAGLFASIILLQSVARHLFAAHDCAVARIQLDRQAGFCHLRDSGGECSLYFWGVLRIHYSMHERQQRSELPALAQLRAASDASFNAHARLTLNPQLTVAAHEVAMERASASSIL